MKIAAISLGCAKNRIDTEELLGYVASRGYILTDDSSAADILIINTCAFIEKAQQESINTILQESELRKGKKPLIVAAGCLPELTGSKILTSIPEIDAAIGVHSYRWIGRVLKGALQGQRSFLSCKPGKDYCTLSPRVLTTQKHSVNVKISEGCNNCCTYCLIPGIRGPLRSRAPEEIVTEVEQLLEQGTREIILVAQDTTAYGMDKPGYGDLTALVKKIMGLKRYFWLRILYAYPSRVKDSLIELIAEDERICNYIDLPIQHSASSVLAGMNRSYGEPRLTELLTNIRLRIPDAALRTTCMVGFPGESRKAFEELLSFLEKAAFNSLGAFEYSNQAGTGAFLRTDQVPARVKARRLSELMLLQKKIAQRLNSRLVGSRLTVMVDRKLRSGSSWYYGRSQRQAPEIDGGIYFRAAAPLAPGSMVSVRISAAFAYNLLAADPKILEELRR